MFVHHEGLVVAYTWNREKQMFVALGKEFDMYTKNFLVASLQFYNDMEYLRNELLKE